MSVVSTESTRTVSERALVKRINRRLPEHERLRACRGDRWRSNLGDYYIVYELTNTIIATHIDLETLGRKVGAIGDDEHLED